VDHRADNRKRRAANGTAIQVDMIRREQPLSPQAGPVTRWIARKQIARRERSGLRAENLLGTLERHAQKRCCNSGVANEIASRKHKHLRVIGGGIMPPSMTILLVA